MSLERIEFNNNNDIENFMSVPIKIVPSINIYHLSEVNLIKPRFRQVENKQINGMHFRVGDYVLSYIFEPKEMKCSCRLEFTLKKK